MAGEASPGICWAGVRRAGQASQGKTGITRQGRHHRAGQHHKAGGASQGKRGITGHMLGRHHMAGEALHGVCRAGIAS